MPAINDAAVAIIGGSSELMRKAADEIALSIFSQLKRRSEPSDGMGGKDWSLEQQCINSIADFIREIAEIGDETEAQLRLSRQLGAFRMARSDYAAAGDCLKPALKDVLGEQATERLCAAWGDAYWRLATPLIQLN